MIVVELSLRVSFTNAVSIIIESKEKKVIIIDRAVSTQRNYTSWVCKFPTQHQHQHQHQNQNQRTKHNKILPLYPFASATC